MTKIILKTFAFEFICQKYALWLAPMFLILSGMIFSFVLWSDHHVFQTGSERTLIPAVFILLTLFSILLGGEKVFLPLAQQQVLQLFFLHPATLRPIVVARVLLHWFFHVLPTAGLSPLLMVLFLDDIAQALLLAVPILIGSLILALLNALVAALTLSVPTNTFFSSLIFLPLALPFLIFTLLATNSLLAMPNPSLWGDALVPLSLLCLTAPLLIMVHFFLTPIVLRQTCV